MKTSSKRTADLPVRAFKSAKDWRAWLAKNHATSPGIWIKIAKKDSGLATVTPIEAIDECLCFGWIDSLKHGFDETHFLQKYTPRKPKGLWSKINVSNVERLIKAKKMTPAGMKEVEAAKADGRWGKAYDSGKTMTVPADFLAALKKKKGALAFFRTLNRANVFAIVWRLQTAKTEAIRAKRFETLVDLMAAGKKIHD